MTIRKSNLRCDDIQRKGSMESLQLELLNEVGKRKGGGGVDKHGKGTLQDGLRGEPSWTLWMVGRLFMRRASYESYAMVDRPCFSAGIPIFVSSSSLITTASLNFLSSSAATAFLGCRSWRWRCILYFQWTSSQNWHFVGTLVHGLFFEILDAALILKLYACEQVDIAFPLTIRIWHAPFRLDWPQNPHG